jgi:hypothetical protein
VATWATHIASAERRQIVIITIEGFGDVTYGQWKFCTAAPDYVTINTAPRYKAWLRDWPEILSERADIWGGVPEGGELSFSILDYDDALTGILRLDAPAVATLSTSPTAAATSWDVVSAANLTDPSVVFCGSEAVEISNISGTALTVSRGALGTTAVPHVAGDPIRPALPYVRGREVRIYLAPADATSSAQETLFGVYHLDGLELSADFNGYEFSAKSELKYLGRMIPRVVNAYTFVRWREGEPAGLAVIRPAQKSYRAARAAWDYAYWLIDGKEIALDLAAGDVPRLRRAQLGTTQAEVKEGTPFVQILVAGESTDEGSFRYSPGPSPSSNRGTGTWTKAQHPVPILLSLLCSSYENADGLELNNRNATYGAYDALPVGYGLGVPHTLIDWPSWMAVWARTAELRWSAFRFGDKAERFAELATRDMLRPLGWFLSVKDAKISLVAPRQPTAYDTLTTIDSSTILLEEGAEGRLPRIRAGWDMDRVLSVVTYITQGAAGERTTVVHNGDFLNTYGQRGYYGQDEGSLEVKFRGPPEDGAESLAYALAERWLYRFQRPPMAIRVEVDLSLEGLAVGEWAGVTCTELPAVSGGTRGVVGLPALVLERTLAVDEDAGARMGLRLLAFGDTAKAKVIAPAALVSSVSGTTATVVANRYTDASGPDGCPTSDAAAFTAGDVVQLVDASGLLLDSGSTATVTSVGSNQIVLSTNFGGALAADKVIIFSASASALTRQLDAYGYFADRAEHTIGATTRTADRWGES